MIVRRSWLIDAEDACARRFLISEIVIHEQRGSRLGQGGRDFSDVKSACVDGCLVHIFVSVRLGTVRTAKGFSIARKDCLA